MAATNLTRNKLTKMRMIVFWMAQQQGKCSVCNECLVKGTSLKQVDELTFDHASSSYDHAKRKEQFKPKGGELMHSVCHKSKTMSENKVWEYKKIA